MLPQAEDIDAINRYIIETPVRTPAAQAARDTWILWHDATGAWERNTSRPAFDHARNLRLAFELANATTDAERGQILETAMSGLSAEQMQGQPDRRATDGSYSEIGESSLLTRVALWTVAGLGVISLAKRTLTR